MMHSQGKLIITLKEGAFVHDKDILSKMDPYCIIRCGNQEKKSSVQKSAGKYPKWYEVSLVTSLHRIMFFIYRLLSFSSTMK
jgi:hypothetical protein